MPHFVPPGFVMMTGFTVFDHGTAARKSGIDTQVNFYDVTLRYGLPGRSEPFFTVIQADIPINRGQGEPIVMCGLTVKKLVIPKEVTVGLTGPGVQYVWQRRGVYYHVYARFGDGLDETLMDQVVCSIIKQ